MIRIDDVVVYADYGYQGAQKRSDISADEYLFQVEWRIAARKGVLKTMPDHDRTWSHAKRVRGRRSSIRS